MLEIGPWKTDDEMEYRREMVKVADTPIPPVVARNGKPRRVVYDRTTKLGALPDEHYDAIMGSIGDMELAIEG